MNGARATIDIANTFVDSCRKMTASISGRIWETINRFTNNPHSPGLNLEQLSNGFMSIRVDYTYRIILIRGSEHDSYVFLWADHHDDAYTWASTRTVQIEQGDIRIYPNMETTNKPIVQGGLFLTVHDRDLLKIGVPEAMLSYVRSIDNEGDLAGAGSVLNAKLHEALSYLASGVTVGEILEYLDAYEETSTVMPLDVREASISDSIITINPALDYQEFQRMLAKPLHMWRHFLHPTQRALVEGNYSGPVKVVGGPGTGKTVVAMHRAKYLVEHIYTDPADKILLTTFTTNLADDIRMTLSSICDESMMQRIDVINIDQVLHNLFARNRIQSSVVYQQERLNEIWNEAIGIVAYDGDLPIDFFVDEWFKVILPQAVDNLRAYYSADRRGRGIRMSRLDKMQVWPVFETYMRLCDEQHITDIYRAFGQAEQMLNQNLIQSEYVSIVIDESQDFDQAKLAFVRALAGEHHANDLFVVGDARQRIYQRPIPLSHCGIVVANRSHQLRINYRTTEQIRGWASRLFANEQIDDLDEGLDSGLGYISLLSGPEPIVEHYSTMDDEIDAIEHSILELIELQPETDSWSNICITFRTRKLLNQYKMRLDKIGINCYEIKSDQVENHDRDGVRMATMHRVKGLEFDHVIIAAVNDTVIPNKTTLDAAIDPVTRRERFSRERNLLFVAATRAKKTLRVYSHGTRSIFLQEL